MKSTITSADLQNSVIAVPPLCRDSALRPCPTQNAKLIRHIEAGGVSTLLYGGNANFYNIAPSEYEAVLDLLEVAAAPGTLVVPSLGPYFGMAMDQAAILASRRFPTAMLLPATAASTPEGVRAGVLKIVEKFGRPIVLYIKDAAYVTLEVVKALVEAGAISWIKYGVVRENPAEDELLAGLVQAVDPALIVSGIGEQPAIAHWTTFGLRSFTSGCVCVAPRRSQEMLLALQAGDLVKAEAIRRKFDLLEAWRNGHGPIPVLHHAVAMAAIAATGPALPLMKNLDVALQQKLGVAARELLAWNQAA